MHPTIHLDILGDQAASYVADALTQQGCRVVRSFDLQGAAATHSFCSCPDHGMDNCTCRYLVLLVYPAGRDGKSFTMAIHSHRCNTYLSLLDGEETEWLTALLPVIGRIGGKPISVSRLNYQPDTEKNMSSKTFTVPNISCGHCTHAIKMKLGELPGVKSVAAEIASRQVTVEWEAPTTWDKIKATLVETNYSPTD